MEFNFLTVSLVLKPTFYFLHKSITKLTCQLSKYKSGAEVLTEADWTVKADQLSNSSVKVAKSGDLRGLRQMLIKVEGRESTPATGK